MKIDLQLPHSYTIRTEVDLPSGSTSSRLHEFIPPSTRFGRESCLLEFVVSQGDSWMGRFTGDYDEPPAISEALSSADPNKACVICAGRGYLVEVPNPRNFEVVACFPICEAKSLSEHALLVFASFTDVVAYGAGGLKWRADGIVSDNLRLAEVTDQAIIVEGWDAASRTTHRLALDIKSGSPRSL
jgi:hypothetical protein